MAMRCGEQYRWRYVEGIIAPPGIALVVGPSVHEGAEHNYKQKVETRQDLPLEEVVEAAADSYERRVADEEVDFGDLDRGTAKDQTVELASCHHQHIAPTTQPAKVEEWMEADIGGDGWILNGRLDLVTEDCVIADLKTSGKKHTQEDIDKSVQLTAYAALYRDHFAEEEKGIRHDVVVKSKRWGATPQQLTTTRTTAQLGALVDLGDRIADSVRSGLFIPRTDWWGCNPKWCGYWDRCAFGGRGRGASVAVVGDPFRGLPGCEEK